MKRLRVGLLLLPFFLGFTACGFFNDMKTGTATGPDADKLRQIILEICHKRNGADETKKCTCVADDLLKSISQRAVKGQLERWHGGDTNRLENAAAKSWSDVCQYK
jgi:hypothetical protein